MTGLQEIRKLMNLPENQVCADCQSAKPDWASTTFGAFICLKCSGIHRSLGTHITLVRSCTLDSWPPKLLSVMQAVGNQKVNEYFEANLPANFQRPKGTDTMAMKRFIEDKYVARKYADKTRDPPHLTLLGNTPVHTSTPTFEQPKPSNPIPSVLGSKTMTRSQSQNANIDDVVASISATTPSTRGKLRARHMRTARETHVLSHSNSANSINEQEPVQAPQVQEEQENTNIDDFFNDEPAPKPKTHTIKTTKTVKTRQKVTKKQTTESIETKPPQPEVKLTNTEIDDFFNDSPKPQPQIQPKQQLVQPSKPQETQSQKKKTVIVRPQPKPVQVEEEEEEEQKEESLADKLDLHLDDEANKEEIDDFFDNDDEGNQEEPKEIKQLPPLQPMNTTINTQPKLKTYDDDAPNPFIEKPQKEEKIEEQNNDYSSMPNVNEGNEDDIDDFFSDNPKPKVETQPPQRQKTQYESCSFVPSKETYHPTQIDKPEFIEKMEQGFDKAKEKSKQALEYLKGKINKLMSKDEEQTQQQTTQISQPPRQTNSTYQSYGSASAFTKPSTPDEDIDDFFGEPKPKQNTQLLNPQQSQNDSQKVYKIHKRGTPQPVSNNETKQQTITRQQQKPKKEETLDDALEFIVGDTSTSQSSSSTVQKKRTKIHRKV
ncbi:ARF GAP-like zinc finger-containing protein [Trichomonas vaginalis G3]|uniref:ARF GAP-like zinc finger-containing protein n=1 Tax=Trichomonas vaginalis (strain ATCC PRA-98 / G3) TaxID=412133 RepID=A2FVR0_TRIV3|nr:GTPase activator protein [Trichomonas vaginalis G3]EAX91012.1 ARF GAP-like zinc finger-containing protein [Trichomonas vaginalis G3]KAI5547596.1 GTPase activator protein [Trichomonas vaginalis G3]|eukprot:XP_001303942.1 ARF GAP-like zinc finger-containing protein [Trichomonas vaginalis G3]